MCHGLSHLWSSLLLFPPSVMLFPLLCQVTSHVSTQAWLQCTSSLSLPLCPEPQSVNYSSFSHNLFKSMSYYLPPIPMYFSSVHSINVCRRNKFCQAWLRKLLRLGLGEFPSSLREYQSKTESKTPTSQCRQGALSPGRALGGDSPARPASSQETKACPNNRFSKQKPGLHLFAGQQLRIPHHSICLGPDLENFTTVLCTSQAST